MAPIRDVLFSQDTQNRLDPLLLANGPVPLKTLVIDLPELLHDFDRCQQIAQTRENWGRTMWGAVSTFTVGYFAFPEKYPIRRKVTLYITGGLSIVAGLGRTISGLMLDNCTQRILEREGVKLVTQKPAPVSDAAEDGDDIADEAADRGVPIAGHDLPMTQYAAHAEPIAQRATSARTVAEGVWVAALAAIGIGLYLRGGGGAAAMQSVTPGLGLSLDGDTLLPGRQLQML